MIFLRQINDRFKWEFYRDSLYTMYITFVNFTFDKYVDAVSNPRLKSSQNS